MFSLKVIDLKNKIFFIKEESLNENYNINPHFWQINKSLIQLYSNSVFVILYSFLEGKIFRLDKQMYDLYFTINQLPSKIPRVFIDYRLIVPNEYNEKLVTINISRFTSDEQVMYLMITQNCNMRCLYCYAYGGRRENKKDMPFSVAKAAIDWLVERSKKKNIKKWISFVGAGENTLRISFIKRVQSYLKKYQRKGINIKLGVISTNGVIPEKIAKWLSKNFERIQVSCDGPAFLQNKYRPLKNKKESSSYVEKTIKYFVKNNVNFQVRAVMTKDFYIHDLEVINYFWQLGVKKILVEPIVYEGAALSLRSKKKINVADKIKIEYQNSILYYKEYKKLTELFNELNLPITIMRFQDLTSRLICGIATKSLFNVDPWGNVAVCERYSGPQSIAENSFVKDFIIGQYDRETKKIKIDNTKWDNLLNIFKNQMEINRCNSCNFFTACPKICLYQIGDLFGTINPSHGFCSSANTKLLLAPIEYIYERYFINKKPCLLYKDNKLYLSLLYTDFELFISYNTEKFNKNPYIIINNLNILPSLYKRMVSYKTRRLSLTVFLLKFQLKKQDLTLKNGIKIMNFLDLLNKSHVYYKISTPLPSSLFGVRYNYIIKKYNIPSNEKESLELYLVKNNKIYFNNKIKGKKKFSEYLDRDEIYKEYLTYSR
ncbi:MAG: radical SAM protein [Minisyncoccia bacterium]